jgi:Fe-S cluster assembly scaffold protein SufB
VVVKTLGAHRSHTHINIVSLIEKDALHVTSNESIDGILLDDTAEIKVLPSMLIDGNSMKASHSVNIGNINPEQLFYLMSRSCSKNEATKILLNAMFHKIKSNEHKSAIRLYNNINEALNKLLEPTHAN